jgi:hypothetical protein
MIWSDVLWFILRFGARKVDGSRRNSAGVLLSPGWGYAMPHWPENLPAHIKPLPPGSGVPPKVHK